MTPLAVSFLFFAAAALGGAVLARAHVAGRRPPGVVAVGHPLLAASGLILLGASFVRAGGPPPTLVAALFLLVLAAAGGFGLAVLRVKRGRAPLAAIAAHAILALTGAGLILYELLAGDPSVPPSM